MKVKMLESVRLANYPKEFTFHKGRTYNATLAINQPQFEEKELVFVEKMVRGSKTELLIEKGEYEFV